MLNALQYIVMVSACLSIDSRNTYEDATKVFHDEVMPSWTSYLKHTERMQGSCVTTMRSIESSAGSTWSWELKKNSKCFLFTSMQATEKGDGNREWRGSNAILRNYNYNATLVKKESASEWIISNIEKRDTKDAIINDNKSTGSLLLIGLNFYAPDISSRPSFRVLSSKQVQINGEVAREFEIMWNIDQHIGRSAVILDSRNSWVVRSATTRIFNGDTWVIEESVVNNYKIQNGVPVPTTRRVDRKIRTNGGLVETGITSEEYNMELRAVPPPDSEFTLTAFGLKEPAWLSLPESRVNMLLYVYLAAGGLCLLFIAIAVARKRRVRPHGSA